MSDWLDDNDLSWDDAVKRFNALDPAPTVRPRTTTWRCPTHGYTITTTATVLSASCCDEMMVLV